MSDDEQDFSEQNSKEFSEDEETTSAETEDVEEIDDGDEETKEELSQATQYSHTASADSGYIASIVGDHPQVSINYYIRIVRGAEKRSSSNQDNGRASSGKAEALLQENLDFDRLNTTFFSNAASEVSAESGSLLETEASLAEWYYSLDEYMQCYVQATAVLQGAPAQEVSIRAEALYRQLHEQKMQNDVSTPPQEGVQQTIVLSAPSVSTFRKPGRELRSRTHTITRRGQGVERLFWHDADAYGHSKFGIRVLIFLAMEFITRGEHGQSFLEMLKKWSKEQKEESFYRSAYALGAVLWYQNVHLLRQIADEWAKVNSFLSRRRAASLLQGAYDIELIEGRKGNNDPDASYVLHLLEEWIERVHKKLSVPNRNLGCAAAHTYGLIGRRSPAISLQGLESLFELGESNDNENTRAIFAAGVSAYVSLAWAGHIRSVIAQLAGNAERYAHNWTLPRNIEERQRYRRKREVHLNATFEAFFLIAATSLPDEHAGFSTFSIFTHPLPPQPAIPDPQGRDILLAAILGKDKLGENIMVLLSAAIVEKNSNPAFDLMRRWAEMVLKIRGTGHEKAEQIYTDFRCFLVALGKMVDQWCLDRKELGFRLTRASDAYKNKLERWVREGKLRSPALAVLAQEILSQLSMSDR